DFSEQTPSEQWAGLSFRGDRVAEVWFKPEGEPLGLVFRIPASSFQIDGVVQRLSAEILLKAVGISTDEVESWRRSGDSESATDPSISELGAPLPQPTNDASDLEIHIRLKSTEPTHDLEAKQEPEFDAIKWHDLEARWKAFLGLEAALDVTR